GASFEIRGGTTEAGDGEEYRFSTLLGTRLGSSGNAMLGIEWTRREAAYYHERDFFRAELFDTTTGGFRVLSRFNNVSYETTASNNAPTQEAVNALFPQRPPGVDIPRTGVFYFNDDLTIFRTEQSGIGFNGPISTGQYKVANVVLREYELGSQMSGPR